MRKAMWEQFKEEESPTNRGMDGGVPKGPKTICRPAAEWGNLADLPDEVHESLPPGVAML